ncbi:ribonuclease H [Brevibacillus laterosporus]|uniref:ribonuclease H family protein n=1 Tax=Brevibacillus laterosporus TaxID=1465 RepID=UPI00215B91D0|nr:ribonuclease H [Brevibacillus laterosporus]MCR8994705.1 ribonuclease HI [Brevibacillus laterosporus]
MPKEIHLWTDGSSVNNGAEKGLGGHGYVLLYGNFEGADLDIKYCDDKYMLTGFGSHTETTNQREEMKACIEGLKRIKNTNINIVVFADSAYLINCMKQRWYDNWRSNGWKNSKKQSVANQDLWEELLEIVEGKGLWVKFEKIKGHDGIYYNEMVDDLARNGLNEARAIYYGRTG